MTLWGLKPLTVEPARCWWLGSPVCLRPLHHNCFINDLNHDPLKAQEPNFRCFMIHVPISFKSSSKICNLHMPSTRDFLVGFISLLSLCSGKTNLFSCTRLAVICSWTLCLDHSSCYILHFQYL